MIEVTPVDISLAILAILALICLWSAYSVRLARREEARARLVVSYSRWLSGRRVRRPQ
jgi:Tfp pilus assembly protein PilE